MPAAGDAQGAHSRGGAQPQRRQLARFECGGGGAARTSGLPPVGWQSVPACRAHRVTVFVLARGPIVRPAPGPALQRTAALALAAHGSAGSPASLPPPLAHLPTSRLRTSGVVMQEASSSCTFRATARPWRHRCRPAEVVQGRAAGRATAGGGGGGDVCPLASPAGQARHQCLHALDRGAGGPSRRPQQRQGGRRPPPRLAARQRCLPRSNGSPHRSRRHRIGGGSRKRPIAARACMGGAQQAPPPSRLPAPACHRPSPTPRVSASPA